jgi:hypothetical protein
LGEDYVEADPRDYRRSNRVTDEMLGWVPPENVMDRRSFILSGLAMVAAGPRAESLSAAPPSPTAFGLFAEHGALTDQLAPDLDQPLFRDDQDLERTASVGRVGDRNALP